MGLQSHRYDSHCSLCRAAIRFGTARPALVTDAIALPLLAITTLVILSLLIRTLFGIAKGELKAMSE